MVRLSVPQKYSSGLVEAKSVTPRLGRVIVRDHGAHSISASLRARIYVSKGLLLLRSELIGVPVVKK